MGAKRARVPDPSRSRRPVRNIQRQGKMSVMGVLQQQPALSYNLTPRAGHNDHRSCGFESGSSTADNGHCYLVDGGTDKLCGLYSQGAVALGQRLPDEQQALVFSVSTRIGNLALGVVSGWNCQLVANSLNNCAPPARNFLN